ncbi:MAG: hypothetical protein Q7T89_17865 [Anaerolineales bacterium]|nr:hypothetical protein [Anaerolineales bacterium]
MKPTRLLAIILFVIFILLLSACGGNSLPSTPEIILPTATQYISPTPTFTPSPTLTATPTPLGGGGTILMGLNQLLVPADISLGEPFVWLSSSSDGSNLKSFGFEIYSVSPDGKRLMVNKDGAITLIDPDGANSVALDTGKDTYLDHSYGFRNDILIPYMQSVLWLSNGKIVFLATELPDRKASFYIVNSDGTDIKKLELLSAAVVDVTKLLFESPNGGDFYWVTGNECNTRGICNPKYYLSRIDDSNQQEVWRQLENASDDIYLSPSGQYIAYFASFENAQSKTGCYLATVAGEPIAKLEILEDNLSFYCNRGSRWSPTEDKILGIGWEGEMENMTTHPAIWSASDGEVTQFPDINAGNCISAEWMPDGKYIFLANCTKTPYFDFYGEERTLGQRLINISDGTVTEYPDFGYCDYVLSPDTQWVFFYGCQNLAYDGVYTYPSQLLNLKTKEAFPVFEKFVSNEKIHWMEGWWSFWVP